MIAPRLQDLDSDFRPRPPSRWRTALLILLGVALTALVLFGLSACSTVVPSAVDSREASYDGGERNSGLIALFSDGSAKITARARERYNALVDAYGRDFLPPISRDAGVDPLPDGTFRIDGAHLVDFDLMSRKRRAGIKPRE